MLTSLPTASQTSAHKSRFTTLASGFWYISIKGLRLALQFWYSRTPVFYLPPGWAPGLVGWVVGFPRVRNEKTSLGLEARGKGVSVLVWASVCAVVVGTVGDAVKGIVGAKGVEEGREAMAQKVDGRESRSKAAGKGR